MDICAPHMCSWMHLKTPFDFLLKQTLVRFELSGLGKSLAFPLHHMLMCKYIYFFSQGKPDRISLLFLRISRWRAAQLPAIAIGNLEGPNWTQTLAGLEMKISWRTLHWNNPFELIVLTHWDCKYIYFLFNHNCKRFSAWDG